MLSNLSTDSVFPSHWEGFVFQTCQSLGDRCYFPCPAFLNVLFVFLWFKIFSHHPPVPIFAIWHSSFILGDPERLPAYNHYSRSSFFCCQYTIM